MPTTVHSMLDALEVGSGMRVLEIGTGTGYTAALLKDRVGPSGTVVSVEIDEYLATRARANLAGVGVGVDVITADGLADHSIGGPFDRVHVTCGIRVVPATWIERTVPGGRIVMPWGTHFAPSHDLLLTLTAGVDGTASGRFEDGLSYMKARGQRTAWPQAPEKWWEHQDATHSTSAVPGAWVEGALTGFGAPVLGLLLPNTVKTVEDRPYDDDDDDAAAADRTTTLSLYRSGPTGLSCARVLYGTTADTTTTAWGPDDLAAEFLAALRWWRRHGRPEAEGFGLAVLANDGRSTQRVWFGEPNETPSWSL
nr:methyltransferase domain-containing protein [Streptomyces sp. SID3343]